MCALDYRNFEEICSPGWGDGMREVQMSLVLIVISYFHTQKLSWFYSKLEIKPLLKIVLRQKSSCHVIKYIFLSWGKHFHCFFHSQRSWFERSTVLLCFHEDSGKNLFCWIKNVGKLAFAKKRLRPSSRSCWILDVSISRWCDLHGGLRFLLCHCCLIQESGFTSNKVFLMCYLALSSQNQSRQYSSIRFSKPWF